MTTLIEKYSRAEILESCLALMFEASLLDCPASTRAAAGDILTLLINEGVLDGKSKPPTTPQYKDICDLLTNLTDEDRNRAIE